MQINSKFRPTELVYLKTDDEQKEYIVSVVHMYPNNLFTYTVGNNGFYTEVYEFELTREKNVNKILTND